MTRSHSHSDSSDHKSTAAGEVGNRDPMNIASDIQIAQAARVDFLAKLSHEIRTPIAAIVGFAELLVPRDDGDQEKIAAIRRNAKLLIGLINNILDLSKLDAGQLELHREVFSPGQLIEEVRSEMDAEALRKSLELVVQLDKNIPAKVVSDPTRLRQILVNLVANSIQFTDHGSISLSAQWLAETNQIRFDVIDTGIGISTEQQSQLFKTYEQGGSGVGLAVSQRLTMALGGEITVRSEIGRGSAFACVVPCEPVDISQHHAITAPVAVDSDPNILSANDGGELGGHPTRRLRALVVDDRRDSRHLLQQFIERSGGEVITAENGRQALDVVARQTSEGKAFDVVLMDVQMPELDGIETTRQLRSLGHGLPIIALTAGSQDDDRARCLQAGYTDFLTKPIATADWDRVRKAYCVDAPVRPAQ